MLDGGKYIDRKFRRAVSVKISIKDTRRGNTATEFRHKTVDKSMRAAETKNLRATLSRRTV